MYAISFDPVDSASKRRIGSTILEIMDSASGVAQGAYNVKLSNGEVVTINGKEKKDVAKGTKVLIEESRTLIFKRKLCQFIRYVDSE